MKTTITHLLLVFFSVGIYAQNSFPVDFELAMADTSWTQFANAGDAAENFAMSENPAKDGINTSDSCIKFTVLDNADPWVGAWSDAFGPIEITDQNYMLEMMVHKDVTTRCGLKLEGDGVDPAEVLVENTTTGVWETITFDFTVAIGKTFNRLVFFPDFPDPRSTGSTCYIDNIGWVGGGTSVSLNKLADISIYPNPAAERITVQHPGMNSVTISNVVGQAVRLFEFPGSDREIIEVSDLKSGLYFITVDSNSGIFSSKFIKE